MEEGTITTPFDMRVQNKIDRFNITKEMIKKLPNLENKKAHILNDMDNKLIEHNRYIREYGIDMEEIRNWKWKK